MKNEGLTPNVFIGVNAYVATLGIGVQAVDLTKVTPPYEVAQQNAIGGTLTGTSTYSVSTAGDKVLAIMGGKLTILSLELEKRSEYTGLNSPYSVTGVGGFPVDIDGDGNIGSFEDNDGDTKTAAQETFDLALVCTSDGIVVIDVTDPEHPKKMDMIPIHTGKVVVDRERRMAFGISGGGLTAISLKGIRPPTNPSEVGGWLDINGDEKDDRLLYTYTDASGMDIVISDEGGSLFAYVADYSGGAVKVVKLNKPEYTIVMVDENGNPLGATLQISYDSQSRPYNAWTGINSTPLQIKNIYNQNDPNDTGTPEMPVVRVKLMPVDPADQNRVLNEGSLELGNATVCWTTKVEYKVSTTAAPQRSRKGLDPTGAGQGNDGFLIWDSSKDCQTGPTHEIDWRDEFGGGGLKITAKATIGGKEETYSYDGKIEGETFNIAFKNRITAYLENPDLDQASPTIRTQVGYDKFFRVIAYIETRYRHFYPSIYGDPKGAIYPRENEDGDGGFGVMQLTDPVPTYEQIWNYKLNIDGGVELLMSKLEEANDWHNKVREGCPTCKPKIKKPQPDAQPLSQGRELKMDVYSLYNSGYHYWKWNSKEKSWYARLGKNPREGTGSYYSEDAESIEKNPPDGF